MTVKERINLKEENMIKKISYNTTVGSFARDIVSSVAIELVKEENDYEDKIYSKFITNATGTDLDVWCADNGIKRREAIPTSGEVTITGINGTVIEKGYKVKNSVNNVEYEVLEEKMISNFSTKVKIKCLTSGIVGNANIGVINQFVGNYQGLTAVTNESKLDNGKDIESDEELRIRAIDLIQKPRISWNEYVFEDVTKEIQEVDKVKCVGRARGKGTADIIITQKNKEIVDEDLKRKVSEYLEFKIISPVDLKVIGATIEILTISIKGELSSDFDVESANIRIKELINKYLFEQIFKKIISYFDLVEIIQHSNCYEHLQSVKLNGTQSDFITDVTKVYKVTDITIN